MTLASALQAFELAALADGVTPKTVAWYVWLLHDSPHAVLPWLSARGINRVREVSTGLLREYIVWLRAQPHSRTGAPQSADTHAGYIRALHRFFSWCALEYDLPDPMARIAFPKTIEQRPKFISMTDFIAMFNVCGEGPKGARDRAILAFLLDTGCRAAGLCGLTISRMDMSKQRAMVIEKGNKARMVVWTKRTAGLLEAWDTRRTPVAPFFYNLRTHQPLTTAGLRVIIRDIAYRAGVQGRVYPHLFRHTLAREYLLNGGDLATLSRIMGHRQQSTTTSYYAIYTHDELAARHEQCSPMAKIEMGGEE